MKRSNGCVLAVLLTAGCSDSDPNSAEDATLLGFANSGCKKEQPAENLQSDGEVASARQAWVGTAYGVEVAGLKCIAWEFAEPGRLTVDLMNFEGACGAEWDGEAALASTGALELGLVNPDCLVAGCGWCIYDWSFDAQGIAPGPTQLAISINTCPEHQDLENHSASLPLDTRASGIQCRYAHWHALDWQASSLGTHGTLGMPCVGSGGLSEVAAEGTARCTDGLECADNGDPGQPVCLRPCASDGDCGTTGALACQEGLCRPSRTW